MNNISIGKAVSLALVAAVISAAVTASVIKRDASVATLAVEKPVPGEAPQAQAVDIAKAMEDRVLGQADAPMTIIEYASMTCDHCAAFHNSALPEIKAALIDTGKAKLIYRDMPWDKFAVKAAKIARCAPPEQYFDLLKNIFETQPAWAHSSDPMKGLLALGVKAGMTESFVQACADSEELEKQILAGVQTAQKEYSVNATPTFIFMKDGARVGSYPEFDEIKAKMPAHSHHHD